MKLAAPSAVRAPGRSGSAGCGPLPALTWIPRSGCTDQLTGCCPTGCCRCRPAPGLIRCSIGAPWGGTLRGLDCAAALIMVYKRSVESAVALVPKQGPVSLRSRGPAHGRQPGWTSVSHTRSTHCTSRRTALQSASAHTLLRACCCVLRVSKVSIAVPSCLRPLCFPICWVAWGQLTIAAHSPV